jgi:tRNA(fMet)-specific endonuclease VapC
LTVIDTSVMVEIIKSSPGALGKIRELEEKGERVATTIITVYELLKGANLSASRQRNLQHVRETLSNIQVLDLSPDACEEASNIFCELQDLGSLISEFDILIAAIAKTNGEAILTHDKHFKSVHGLDLIKW